MGQKQAVKMVIDVGLGIHDTPYLKKILSMGVRVAKEGQTRIAWVVHQPTCQLWHHPPCTCQPSLRIVERDA